MQYAAETMKVVNLLPPKDISGAAFSAAYVNMANYGHLDIILHLGATGAIGSSIAVTMKQAINTSGSSSAALPIGHYYKNQAALGSSSIANDTYTKTSVASSGATFNLVPSTNNIAYIIPVDAQDLSDPKNCVGVSVGSAAAATLVGAVAVLSNSRYAQSNPPSAL